MDMSLLGWYDSQDETGGNVKELLYSGDNEQGNPIYEDDRTVQKYYRPIKGHQLYRSSWKATAT